MSEKTIISIPTKNDEAWALNSTDLSIYAETLKAVLFRPDNAPHPALSAQKYGWRIAVIANAIQQAREGKLEEAIIDALETLEVSYFPFNHAPSCDIIYSIFEEEFGLQGELKEKVLERIFRNSVQYIEWYTKRSGETPLGKRDTIKLLDELAVLDEVEYLYKVKVLKELGLIDSESAFDMDNPLLSSYRLYEEEKFAPWYIYGKEFCSNCIWDLDSLLNRYDDKESNLALLEIAKSLVIRDLCASYQSRIVYSKDPSFPEIGSLFPIGAKESGHEYSKENCFIPKAIDIDLSKVPVISAPRDWDKLLKSKRRFSPFKGDEENHAGNWYPTLGVAVVYNGIHSATEGSLYRDEAIVRLNLVRDDILLYHMEAGQFWAYPSGEKEEVIDYRVMILWHIQRQILKLEEQMNLS